MSLVPPIRTSAPTISRRGLNPVFLGLGFVFIAALSFFVGSEFSSEIDDFKLQQVEELEDRLSLSEQARKQLMEKIARQERDEQVSNASDISTKKLIKKLETENQTLSKEIEFLKTLVSGDVRKLAVTKAEFIETDSGKITYAITLSKLAEDSIRVEGYLTIDAEVEKEGERLIIPASELKIKNLKMGFREFQNFKGSFELANDVTAKSYIIRVNPRGRAYKSFDHAVSAEES
jgi:hypothetical protein